MSHFNKRPILYNPAEKAPEDLVAEFSVREQEFSTVIDELKSTDWNHPGQHFLIVGQRGMGKTTLLYRIKYEIQDDLNLRDLVVPVSFREEHYGISNLFDVWVTVAESLETTHSFPLDDVFQEIDPFWEDELVDQLIFNILVEWLQESGLHLVLLIDNFENLLSKLEKYEIQRLRDVLMTCPEIRLVAANPDMLDQQIDYQKPFFSFFQLIRLKGLSREETLSLIRRLGQINGKEEDINHFLQTNQHRVESLRRLSGGVVRTILQLFEIYLDQESGKTIDDLQLILDKMTPLYKARMDNLKPQQQRIVDFVAREWDAVSTGEIAKKLRLPSNKVSAQLKQLIDSQIIEKVKTDSKNHLYRIQERFFNVWYLMRSTRNKDRDRINWLVNFFDIWFDQNDYQNRIFLYLSEIQSGKAKPKDALLLSQVFSRSKYADERLANTVIKKTKSYLEKNAPEISKELNPSNEELWDQWKWYTGLSVEEKKIPENVEKGLKILKSLSIKNGNAHYWLGDLYFKKQDWHSSLHHFQKSFEMGEIDALVHLGWVYEELNNLEQAKKCFLLAIEGGDKDGYLELGRLHTDDGEYKEAEPLLIYAEKEGVEMASLELGEFYLEIENYPKAEIFLKKAINQGYENAYLSLGRLFLATGKYEGAKENFMVAETLGVPGGTFNLGEMAFLELDLELARQKIQKEKEFDLWSASHLLGLISLMEGKFDQARKELEFALKEESAFAKAIMAGIFINQKDKIAAQKYAGTPRDFEYPSIFGFIQAIIQIWSNQFEEANKTFSNALYGLHSEFTALQKSLLHPLALLDINSFFLFLIAKKQYHSLKKYFDQQSPFGDLKEVLKPTYYALMFHLQDEYPNEYLKMGPELEETVQEIIAKAKQMAIDYA